jgi:(1->4)-alpha-D-glucan 1-alpha-D-glucosylmutase
MASIVFRSAKKVRLVWPPRPDPEALRRLLDCQHYRLASWRTANDALNWRRFFTISELAGLRTEDPDVFEAVHALIFRLYGEDLIDGVRVDHVDGLTDPAGYCRRLRERLDAIARPGDVPAGPAYIVIEKILAVGEDLPSDWSVDGTSGYDFMQDVAALLHDPAGEAPLGQLWAELSGRPEAFAPEELRARQDMLAWQFEGQLVRCVAAFEALARSVPEAEGVTTGMLRRGDRAAALGFSGVPHLRHRHRFPRERCPYPGYRAGAVAGFHAAGRGMGHRSPAVLARR